MTPARAAMEGGRVVAIVGPTASGKTEIAGELARSRPGAFEVVAGDAFTIYRGMDVGTAKPFPEERGLVRHHLIDVLEPTEDATVAWFQHEARLAIEDIHGRGRVPLLVGGSGLYFRAVVDDLRFPPTDTTVRARLEAEVTDDVGVAYERLRSLDPDGADKIDPGNVRRIVRALEVIELTGERFSSFAAAWDRYESIYDLTVIGIDRPTDELRERIDARAAAMVEAGLLDEAAALRGQDTDLSRTARQAIGYAEAFDVLAGEAVPGELPARIATRTMRYARRQRSWFRADPRVTWLDADAAVAMVLGALDPGAA